MVPMLTCGLVRSNRAFATVDPFPSGVVPVFYVRLSWTVVVFFVDCRTVLLARRLRDDFLRHVLRYLRVAVEHHRVARPSLRLRPQVTDVAEHLRQRHERLDDP